MSDHVTIDFSGTDELSSVVSKVISALQQLNTALDNTSKKTETMKSAANDVNKVWDNVANNVKGFMSKIDSSSTASVSNIKSKWASIEEVWNKINTADKQATASFSSTTKEAKTFTETISGIASTVKQTFGSFTELGAVLWTVEKAFRSVGMVVSFVANSFKAAMALSEQGAAFESLAEGFNNVAESVNASGDNILAKLQDISNHTIDNFKLMQMASNAAIYGIDVQYLPKLMEIARAAAKSTGKDVSYMYDSIVLGIERSSSKILDNLNILYRANDAYKDYAASIGKTVNELSAEEKVQATLNAVLKSGQQIIDKMGDSMKEMTSQERWQAMHTSVTNLGNTIAVLVQPAFDGIVSSTTSVANGISKWITLLIEAKQRADAVGERKEFREEMPKKSWSQALLEFQLPALGSTKKFIDAYGEQLKSLYTLIDKMAVEPTLFGALKPQRDLGMTQVSSKYKFDIPIEEKGNTLDLIAKIDTMIKGIQGSFAESGKGAITELTKVKTSLLEAANKVTMLDDAILEMEKAIKLAQKTAADFDGNYDVLAAYQTAFSKIYDSFTEASTKPENETIKDSLLKQQSAFADMYLVLVDYMQKSNGTKKAGDRSSFTGVMPYEELWALFMTNYKPVESNGLVQALPYEELFALFSQKDNYRKYDREANVFNGFTPEYIAAKSTDGKATSESQWYQLFNLLQPLITKGLSIIPNPTTPYVNDKGEQVTPYSGDTSVGMEQLANFITSGLVNTITTISAINTSFAEGTGFVGTRDEEGNISGGTEIGNLFAGLTFFDTTLISAANMLGQMVGSIGSLNSLLNPLQTILQGFMAIISPLVSTILQPIIGILYVVGNVLGQMLAPFLSALAPVIKVIGEGFVWLYNNAIIPFANGIIWIGNSLQNAIVDFLTWLGLATAADKVALTSGMLEAIDYASLVASGASSSSYINSTAASSSASYSEGTIVNQYIYIYGGTYVGDEGFTAFVQRIFEEAKSLNILGAT